MTKEEKQRREAERVFRERVAALRALGFDEIDALEIAETDASISDIRTRLVERGATPKQAARIMRPLA